MTQAGGRSALGEHPVVRRAPGEVARPLLTSWVDAEPGWDDAIGEIRSVGMRARKRWPLVVLFTVLLTAAVAVRTLRHQRTYESTVVMRVVEKSLDPETAPPASGELSAHILQVALSRQALIAIADQFGLYRSKRLIDVSLVEQGMREAIELNVFENDFDSVAGDDFARTTRIAVTFAGPDPEVTLAVVRRLGELIEESQLGERQVWSTSVAQGIDQGVEQLHREVVKLREREARLTFEHAPVQSPMAVEVAKRHVQASIARTVDQLNEFEASAWRLRLRSAFETTEGGLRFEMVDPGHLAEVMLTDSQRIMLYTLCAGLALFPLVVLAVGTFDSRARDSDGLRRNGLVPLGEVGSFEGMDCGAWARRTSALRGET